MVGCVAGVAHAAPATDAKRFTGRRAVTATNPVEQVVDPDGPDVVEWPGKLDLFGVGVSPTNYDDATAVILRAARQGRGGVVSCHAVHALVTASCDPSFTRQVNTFEMITPDGQPVRWALNMFRGAGLRDRVYGPQLMLSLCRGAAEQGIPIYLYGGGPGVAEQLEDRLTKMFPGLKVAGKESPPFRPLTTEEDEATIDRINSSGAGLVFIGLGFPKQDHFAYQHRTRLKGIQLCVGAAFDFHAGIKKSAPPWMQRCGLEWLYRLLQEPGRLWRRYLVTNSIFLWKCGGEVARCIFTGRKVRRAK